MKFVLCIPYEESVRNTFFSPGINYRHNVITGVLLLLYRICRKPEERCHFEDLDLDGMIILKWIYGKCLVGDGLDLYGSGQEKVPDCFKSVITSRWFHRVQGIS